MRQPLAYKSGFGRVSMCRECSDLHIAVQNINLRLNPKAFEELAEMIQEAMRHPRLAMTRENPQEFMADRLFSRA